MTLDQVIASGASIGTCVAAVLAYLSLRETSIQRKTSLRPQLVFKRQPIYATEIDCLGVWSREEHTEVTQHSHFPHYGVQLSNIGIGAAKNIKIQWEFDAAAIAAEINRLAAKDRDHIPVKEVSDRFLKLVPRAGGETTFILGVDWYQQFDFLMPYSEEAPGLEIKVPISFVSIISMYFNEMLQTDVREQIRNIPDSLFEATVSIGFEDIGGQKYAQTFRAGVKLTASMRGNEHSSPKFYATMEFTSA